MEIDLTFLSQLDPSTVKNIVIGLIVIISVFFLFAILKAYHSWIWLPAKQLKYLKSIDYILLAIDVPKENVQSPKAVEAIFSTLWGSYSGPNKKQKYIDGQLVPPFSLEIVSIDGYIQYLIRTPRHFRDMVEAAIFSQYPDAQITEVNDYVPTIDQKYPSDEYQIWGTELKLFKENAYPIRTYPFFEHSLSQEFKDPMAALLEVFSKLGQGEQAWLQFVITAVKPADWLSEAEKTVARLIGAKVPYKKTWADRITDPILNFFHWLADTTVVTAEKNDPITPSTELNNLMYLTPGEQNQLSAIQMKMSKLGFECSMRYIYVAKKKNYQPAKGINPVFGAINQFNTLDLNSFVPNGKTLTSVDYFFVKSRVAKRQNNLLRRYRDRINQAGSVTKPFILNIEELATVFHFPDTEVVKTPLIKKTESKRSEPPTSLPVEGFEEEEEEESFSESFSKANKLQSTQSIKEELSMDLNNSYFEDRFARSEPVINPNLSQDISKTRDATVLEPKSKPKTTKLSEVTNKPKRSKNNNQDNGQAPPNLPI